MEEREEVMEVGKEKEEEGWIEEASSSIYTRTHTYL